VFVIHKPVLLLHLFGQVIRTTADHPFFVSGEGWVDANALHIGDLLATCDGQPVAVEGISDSGEQTVLYNVLPGEHPLPDRSPSNGIPPGSIFGFAAGTPILTPNGPIPIDQLRPGDFVQFGPDGSPAADPDADHSDEPEQPRR
jgi:hypothetical protein